MKRKYLTKAIVILAVLVLASSVPAIVSSFTEAQSQSLVKSNQTTFIPEYQHVSSEESYNKIV